MRLHGKTAIITGAGRGIGRSIAQRFVSEGAVVVVADIDEVSGAATAFELGAAARAFQVDVSDPGRVEAMVAQALDWSGRLDVLVNVAGIGLTRLLVDTTIEEWRRIVDVNLTGAFLCSKAAARAMIPRRAGRIINIASLSGQRGGTGRAAYGASKAGVTALTKVMAVELAQYGITSNEIAPGPVNTEMTAVTHDDATRRAYHDLIPMRRYAERDEIADAAVFLASAEANFVNGHTLNVDGGFLAAGLMFEMKNT